MKLPTTALELNPVGVAIYGDGGWLAAPSPGYALFDAGGLVTGRAARERARLSPRRVQNRFWEELDATGFVARPFPRGLTHADLAYHHLRDLRREVPEPGPVVVAVSGAYGEAQLGLFLGISATAGWEVGGLVDSAVAATAADVTAEGSVLYLDLELHRAVLSELRYRPDEEREIERCGVLVETGVGWAALETAWARFFASSFVRATRFDPLHSAVSEQRLYLEMDGWLDSLAAAERVELTLAAGSGERQVEIMRSQLVAAATDFYDRLARLVAAAPTAGEECRLVLGHRLHRLPGLADHLATACGLETSGLPAAAAATGALASREWIAGGDGGPRLVIRLPRRSGGAT